MFETPDNVCDELKQQDAILGAEIGDPDYRSAATDAFCPNDNSSDAPPDGGYNPQPDDGSNDSSDGGYSASPPDEDPPAETSDGGYSEDSGGNDAPQVEDTQPDYDSGY